jgi:hypothetical protein
MRRLSFPDFPAEGDLLVRLRKLLLRDLQRVRFGQPRRRVLLHQEKEEPADQRHRKIHTEVRFHMSVFWPYFPFTSVWHISIVCRFILKMRSGGDRLADVVPGVSEPRRFRDLVDHYDDIVAKKNGSNRKLIVLTNAFLMQ